MKTVAFVPVKLNNQRIPGKNTKTFDDGSALITVFLRNLIKTSGIDELYVFCSDFGITKYLIPGVKFLERPKYLDTQEATPQDIISEFIRRVEADIYAVCHCTSPFVSAEHMGNCISAVKNGKHDSAFTAQKIQRLLWKSDNVPLNFDPSNIPRTQDLEVIYSEVSAMYVFTKKVFIETQRRVGYHPFIQEVSGVECIDIDVPEDFEIAKAVFKEIVNKEDIQQKSALKTSGGGHNELKPITADCTTLISVLHRTEVAA